MMKKKLILSTFIVLTGCAGPGDKLVPRAATKVVLNNKSICALSTMKPGEKMTAMEVYSSNENPLFIRFYDKPLYIPYGHCLPLFGAHFGYDSKYTVSWDIHTPEGLRMITAQFTLSPDSAGQPSSITELNP